DRIATVILSDRDGASSVVSTKTGVIFRSGFETPTAGTNSEPVALSQATTTDEDVPVLITLTGSDVDGDSLTFAIVTTATNGTLGAITQLTSTSAQATYTPDADFNGADAFTFLVNDGLVDSAAATVSITVEPINDAPV